MKRLTILFALLIGANAIVSCGPDAPTRWQIQDPATGITIGAGSRVAGVVDSVVYKGKEYINACDHGRELQLAVTTTFGECYNPTEAGSSDDSGGAKTTSKLLGLRTDGNVLRTTIAPAFWMIPGQCEQGCGCARNTKNVSDYIMDKAVSFSPKGIPNSFAFLADVHVPETVTRLQLESPTGYLNGEFNKFWTIDPSTGKTTQVPSPGQGKGIGSPIPFCLGTNDDVNVMCAISVPNNPNSYVLYDFSQLKPYEESTTKWSIVRIWNNVNAGTVLGIQAYICLGTLADVQKCIPQLASEFGYTSPSQPHTIVQLGNYSSFSSVL